MYYLVILIYIFVNGVLSLFIISFIFYFMYVYNILSFFFCKVYVKKDKENIYNQMLELQGVFILDLIVISFYVCGMKV